MILIKHVTSHKFLLRLQGDCQVQRKEVENNPTTGSTEDKLCSNPTSQFDRSLRATHGEVLLQLKANLLEASLLVNQERKGGTPAFGLA